jgi:hypothetical protein
LTDEPIFLVDIGFSHTAEYRVVLATRIIAPEGIAHMTGSALPVGQLSREEQAALRKRLLSQHGYSDCRDLSPLEKSGLTTSIIRHCLRNDSEMQVVYLQP